MGEPTIIYIFQLNTGTPRPGWKILYSEIRVGFLVFTHVSK